MAEIWQQQNISPVGGDTEAKASIKKIYKRVIQILPDNNVLESNTLAKQANDSTQ